MIFIKLRKFRIKDLEYKIMENLSYVDIEDRVDDVAITYYYKDGRSEHEIIDMEKIKFFSDIVKVLDVYKDND